jgi:4-aminobutyrate aminotransferase-like enzyme
MAGLTPEQFRTQYGKYFNAHRIDFELGVLVVASSQRWDVVKLYPPLVVESAELDAFLERMESALDRLT